MPSLVAILVSLIGALVLSIKTYRGQQKDASGNPIPDPLSPLAYFIIALVAAFIGAALFLVGNPHLFDGDPLFAAYPAIGAALAAFISVLPPGIGTTVLTILALRSGQLPPAVPSQNVPDVVIGKATPISRAQQRIRNGFVLFG